MQPGIQAFLAVVHTGGVNKAAKMLYLTQPGVSKRLKLLEEELGICLFERARGCKEVVLTQEGEAFLDVAERWAALHKEVQSLKTHSGKLVLNIGSIAGINYEGFNSVFRRMLRHDPPVYMRLTTALSKTLYERVAQQTLDVALTRVLRNHTNVVVHTLYSEPLLGLCLPESAFAGRQGVHPTELKAEHEIISRVDTAYQVWHDRWWSTYCLERLEVDSIYLVLALMCEPYHWALLPYYVVKKACADGKFASFTLSEPTPERGCYRLVHKHPKRGVAAALKIFDTCLAAEVQSDSRVTKPPKIFLP